MTDSTTDETLMPARERASLMVAAILTEIGEAGRHRKDEVPDE